jgi:predicted glycogen debranching enzyme
MPAVASDDRSVTLTAWPEARPYRVEALGGVFQPRTPPQWYWNFARRAERERGLDDREDLLAPGAFRLTLAPGERAVLLITAEPELHVASWRSSLNAHQARGAELLRTAGVEQEPALVQRLTLAADQFLVARVTADGGRGRTVVAGYHWFGDWGRDTMIALPGLTLATGRAAECAEVLRTFARYLDQGMLPNRFPDAGEAPEYNTVDATLWFFQAIRAYERTTGDRALVDELLPALRDVIDWHVRGTRHGIRVDAADGLLRCGEPGVQLTWMDARVGDRVITPRTGKPVEVNALWHAALCTLAEFCAARNESDATRYTAMAERAAASFRARFWRPELDYLADVVGTPDDTDDLKLRPNQIFAVSLPDPLLEPAQARAVVEAVGRSLLTTYGLRSLAPADAAYIGHYGGGVGERDGAYHQGTVWTWLLGPYAEAHFKVYGDRRAARHLLRPLAHHLLDAGLGTISEIMDGDAPHAPRGCIAQAWSVGEALRVWKLLGDDG